MRQEREQAKVEQWLNTQRPRAGRVTSMGLSVMAQRSEHMMSIPSRTEKQPWIGLAHVRPRQENELLEGAIGAFVPIVALAMGIDDFISMATTLVNSYGFDVVVIEDIQPLEERLKNSEVEEGVIRLAEGLSETEPIAFDTFQAYDNE